MPTFSVLLLCVGLLPGRVKAIQQFIFVSHDDPGSVERTLRIILQRWRHLESFDSVCPVGFHNIDTTDIKLLSLHSDAVSPAPIILTRCTRIFFSLKIITH